MYSVKSMTIIGQKPLIEYPWANEIDNAMAKTTATKIRAISVSRVVGVIKDSQTIVWFWIGSLAEYDKLLKNP